MANADISNILFCIGSVKIHANWGAFSGMNSMANQPRVAKVLVALLVSMTTGAIVLMALGNNPPSAGAFCLSSYYRLDPVNDAILSRQSQSADRWNSIEVFYTGTKAGNIEQLAALSGLAQAEDLNCHFVICNGLGGPDGEILTTEKWQRQWSAIPGGTWYGSGQTIRIAVISDGNGNMPTDAQISRTEALVQSLYRRFNLHPEHIYYPQNWHLTN